MSPKEENSQTKKQIQIYLGNCNREIFEAGINESKLLIEGQAYVLNYTTYILDMYLHSHVHITFAYRFVGQVICEYEIFSCLQYNDGTDNDRFLILMWEDKKGW